MSITGSSSGDAWKTSRSPGAWRSSPQSVGGPRSAAIGGGSSGPPRWVRISRIGPGSVRPTASRRSRGARNTRRGDRRLCDRPARGPCLGRQPREVSGDSAGGAPGNDPAGSMLTGWILGQIGDDAESSRSAAAWPMLPRHTRTSGFGRSRFHPERSPTCRHCRRQADLRSPSVPAEYCLGLVCRSPYLAALVGMLPECLVGHEREIDHLTPPRHVRFGQQPEQVRDPAWERLGPGDPDIDVAAMVAMPPGPRSEQENLVPRIGHGFEADPPSRGDIFPRRACGGSRVWSGLSRDRSTRRWGYRRPRRPTFYGTGAGHHIRASCLPASTTSTPDRRR